ncbi:MAG: hypothetical protein KF819_08805 [Labilithrix sp.]|nr:hypothetical protein [Labilithrix sp.]
MKAFRHGARLTAAIALACAWGACSSVPDVTFGELDEGGVADASPIDGASPTDAGDGAPIDAPTDQGSPGCPSAPPPGAICCGDKPCIGCTTAQCADCTSAACAAPQQCCRRGTNVQCRALDNCN